MGGMDTLANRTTAPGTTRPTADAILDAASRVIVRRGADATRIADIAAEAGTSTGTVHYYFETKEEVLVAALKWANERPYERLDELLAQEADDLARLGTLLELSIPYPGPAREEWIFFLELWGWILHRPELLADSATVDSRWRSYFVDIVRSGTASGVFRPVAPPDEVADRLVALVDGLGLKAVLGQPWMSPDRMRGILLRFASSQLGIPHEALARAATLG
jgi:AcrR family transcriptional regulator